MSVHVPAWKRLGLKLKYAKEQPENTPTAVSTNVHDRDLAASERPVKRRRVVKNDALTSPEQSSSHSSSDNAAQKRKSKEPAPINGSLQQPIPSAGSLTQSIQRKKSVTFSEETKQDDGDSRITIDFPAGSPGSTPRKTKTLSTDESSESPETTTINNNADSTASNDNTTPTKKQSKPKTSKKSKQSKASTKNKSSSALDYLTQHRLTRDSWKFNKIIDVWILNHALDIQAIPSTHLPSLAGYVRGLPAKAGSRDRLIKECRETLSSSQLDRDTNEEDRNIFIHWVESQEGPLEDATHLEDFLQAHSRAALLLWSLDEPVSETSHGGNTSNSFTQQDTLPVRKKKSRTSAPIDVSSSETDSDSDSSDDSSESEGETAAKTKVKPRVVVNGSAGGDDTSSSGTSSSEDENEDNTSSSGGSSDSSSDDNDE